MRHTALLAASATAPGQTRKHVQLLSLPCYDQGSYCCANRSGVGQPCASSTESRASSALDRHPCPTFNYTAPPTPATFRVLRDFQIRPGPALVCLSTPALPAVNRA